mmetsp:Transcript_26188/g.28562  ORF Transcript_26188/g.28562 Transcript_26188/m.28562 type:complete len:155 (+) Transcript_26188:112-576(+)
MTSPMSQQENKDVPVNVTLNSDEVVGCRRCSAVICGRYIILALIFVAGFVVIFATPRVCPSGFEEHTCYTDCSSCVPICNQYTGENCSDCCENSYSCWNSSANECANETPSIGAIAGGVVIIVIASILACISCCHQARCVLSNTYYDNKIAFCC